MHKKSVEASHKLTEDDDDISDSSKKDEFRSESIASLRAKAQEHSIKVLEGIYSTGNQSHFHHRTTSGDITSVSRPRDTNAGHVGGVLDNI